jgi:hypothetical protein
MQKGLCFSILLIMTSLCLSLSAQSPSANYKELYNQAGVLAQNSLFDEAKRYYFDALNAVPQGNQYRNVKNQIKEKIQLMECYQKFYHLWQQAQELEQRHDFESAHKYYADAVSYATFEKLNIPESDSIKARLQIIEQTSTLCKNLFMIELLNLQGEHAKARNMYYQWVKQAESLGYQWKNYDFPPDFVQKMDSISDFLEDDRNETLPYRSVFPEEYAAIEDYLFHLLDNAASQNSKPIETDVTFVFSLDTNGILETYIKGNQLDKDLQLALKKDAHVQMTQPYRYGFSLPTKEEIRYHVSSTKYSVWVEKGKNGYKVKDAKLKKQYMEVFRKQLSDAPDGKYLFLIHRNVIDDKVQSSVRLTDAKGGKAKKWLKSR